MMNPQFQFPKGTEQSRKRQTMDLEGKTDSDQLVYTIMILIVLALKYDLIMFGPFSLFFNFCYLPPNSFF